MEYLLWARPCVGASDKIRQRTQSSVERTGMQINSSIKYCGSLTDVLSKVQWRPSVLLGNQKRVSRDDCSCSGS